MTDGSQPRPQPISAILRAIAAEPERRRTVGEIVESFGHRAFGALLLVFGAPNLLPLPPGSTTLLGAPLLLLAPQVAIGVHAPWLPQSLAARAVSGSEVGRALGRLLPWLEKLERVSRPRLGFLFGPVGDRTIGLVCTILAFILILPIPLGNILPALTITVMGLALAQRDGVLAIAGYLLAAVSGAAVALTFGAVTQAVRHLLNWFGAA